MSSDRFEFVFRASRGHKFFRDRKDPDRYAVVDDSGTTPENADHELLWVDPTRRIQAGRSGGFAIPVVNRMAERFYTPCDFTEAAWVAENMGLEIEDAYGAYRITRIAAPSTEITSARLAKSNTWSY